MSIVGTRFRKVWYLDPAGTIWIASLILFSWASTAFKHMWYLVGKSAPQDFLNKLVYVAITHDPKVQKIDTVSDASLRSYCTSQAKAFDEQVRAYHAGDKYSVEIDVIMGRDEPLKVTHDIAERLQRKLEGLADVERAFVHVDYDGIHDIMEEHKPLHDRDQKVPLLERLRERLSFRSTVMEAEEVKPTMFERAKVKMGLEKSD